MGKKMVLEGKLAASSQEGGYASPAIVIDGSDVTKAIWDLLEEFEGREWPGEIGDVPGNWRVTVEEI